MQIRFIANSTPAARDAQAPGATASPIPSAEARRIKSDVDAARTTAMSALNNDRFRVMSGLLGLTRDLEAMGESLDIFASRIQSGGHRSSIVAIAEGRADVAAIDCESWALAKRFEPAARRVKVVGWTRRRKGLPFITARTTPEKSVRAMPR